MTSPAPRGGIARAPFTLLTGFLGAGKTTALNRMLEGFAQHSTGKRVAVLVNELGRVAIDNRLIVGASGDVIELAGGCLCCKLDLRSDLWGGIVDIIERSRPDHVILETTGIAEPPAILTGLSHFKVKEWVEPAGVVCVVDAADGGSVVRARDEARSQLECADRVLLSKMDIADHQAIAAVHNTLDELGVQAERASFPPTSTGNASMGAWVCEKRAPRRTQTSGASNHGHRHEKHKHSQVSAASFVDSEPLAAEPLVATVRALADSLLRVKGFVHLAGEDRRGKLDLASGRVELTFGEPWSAEEERRSELVFIGEGVEEDAVRRRLWACRVSDPSV